jgi:hypothetical protein
MPALRGHHLICLQFFDGEGYDQKFKDNLKSVIALLKNDQLEIVAGADDICSKCPYLKNSACHYEENAEKEIRKMDTAALNLLNITAGNMVNWDRIKSMLPQIFAEWHESFCIDCAWLKVCEKNDLFRQLTLKSNE